jgi:hypothetical protein
VIRLHPAVNQRNRHVESEVADIPDFDLEFGGWLSKNIRVCVRKSAEKVRKLSMYFGFLIMHVLDR